MMTWLGVIGFFLLTMGISVGLGALRRRGLGAKIRGLVFSAIVLSLGLLCVGLTMALRSFEAFADSVKVSEVRCTWVGSKEFTLTYIPFRRGTPKAPKTFRLRGDQWSISGGVVKWHPWLTALGIMSYHRPTRISGRYAQTAEETQGSPTAFNLNGELDWIWWVFYRLDPFLPFVDATYGSSAFTYVNPALLVEVHVTPSGYLIQHRRPGPRPKPSS